MSKHCDELEKCGFHKRDEYPLIAGLESAGCSVALANIEFAPGVSTYISYLPCMRSQDHVFISHAQDGQSECWHRMSDDVDLFRARQQALGIAIEALDSDLDLWEVRGQFAFADPDIKTHRWHAQRSRLRLSSLRFEVGRISRESREFKDLASTSQRLRSRVTEAYRLLAEMTNSSLADKADIEVTQRENLNLLLSVIAALVLAPGVVIGFDSAVRVTKNPFSLLLVCAASSLIAAALIIGFSGVRLRLGNRISRYSYLASISALVTGVILLAFLIKSSQRIEGLALLMSSLLCAAVLIIPWGRRHESEAAPTRWSATWDGIRNDRPESWSRLNEEGSL
jgi:hypothetical protein